MQSLKTTAEVVILPPMPHDAGQAALAPFVEACYQIADAEDIPLVDLNSRWNGSYTTANALGLMFDASHPNRLGYRDMGAGVSAAVFQAPGPPITPPTPAPMHAAVAPYTLPVTTFTRRYLADRLNRASGAVPVSWPDETGAGAALSNTDATARPTVKLDSLGHRYLEFDGSNDAIDGLLPGAFPAAVTSRIRFRSLPAAANVRWLFQAFRADSLGALWLESDGSLTLYGNTSSIKSAAGVIVANTDYDITGIWNGATSKIIVNGTVVASAVSDIGSPTFGGRLYIGRVGGSAAASFPALPAINLREVLFWPLAPADASITSTHTAMDTYYAATAP